MKDTAPASAKHVVTGIYYAPPRSGLTCWAICSCGASQDAPTDGELYTAWCNHLRAAGAPVPGAIRANAHQNASGFDYGRQSVRSR